MFSFWLHLLHGWNLDTSDFYIDILCEGLIKYIITGLVLQNCCHERDECKHEFTYGNKK